MPFGFNEDKSKFDLDKMIDQFLSLVSGKANNGHTHSASDVTDGVLAVERGGTGHDTLQALRNAVGLGDTTGALPVANGGTGATNAAAARRSLGANNASNLSEGTVPRARIESTNWVYMYGSASATNFSRWRMVAGIVFVEINYENHAGVGPSSGANFGTIPSGYRPTRVVTASGYLGSGNNNTSCMWVNVSGQVLANAAVSSSAFYGSLSYPLG